MGWACPQDGAIRHRQSLHALEPTWQKIEGKTERDLSTDSRKRNKGEWFQLRRAAREGEEPTAVEVCLVYGHGFMCRRARRGLSG